MVSGCDDGDENGGWVCDADEDAEGAAERGDAHAEAHCEGYAAGARVLWREGKRHDGQADEERVAKVQRGHSRVLVAELVCCPDAGFARGAVHSVDEAVATGFFAYGAGDVWIREESWWHAGPEGEDDEGDEVARGHSAAASSVEEWASRTAICLACGLVMEREVDAVAGSGVVV